MCKGDFRWLTVVLLSTKFLAKVSNSWMSLITMSLLRLLIVGKSFLIMAFPELLSISEKKII